MIPSPWVGSGVDVRQTSTAHLDMGNAIPSLRLTFHSLERECAEAIVLGAVGRDSEVQTDTSPGSWPAIRRRAIYVKLGF